MTTPDGLVAITYNGEVYNAPTLRRDLESLGVRFKSRTDTEVLLHGFVRWGTRALLHRAQGMFAFAIWDARPTSKGLPPVLTAAVDHAGMKPLYWHLSRQTLSIASTADALREALADRPDPDPIGLCHVLSLGYCPAPTTVWRGISKLGPAQFFEWSPGQGSPETRSWWNPPEVHVETNGDRAEQFNSLFSEITQEHLHTDVPASLLLSAGIDSTTLAVTLAQRDRSIPCVTLGLPGPDDESQPAAETAAYLGLSHRAARLHEDSVPDLVRQAAQAFDEPQGFGALLTMMQAARAARQSGPVVLAGDGGDEAFGGYTWHRPEQRPTRANAAETHQLSARVARPDAAHADRAAALTALAARSTVHQHLQSVMPRFHPAEAAALLAPLNPDYDDHAYAAWLAPHDQPNLSPVRRRQRLDLFSFCPGSILPKLDRAPMAFGLELRAPFLDRRLLEWSLTLPESLAESHPDGSKAVLRSFLRGRVPPAVLTRPKQGFSLRVALSDVLPAMLESIDSSRLVSSGILRRDWRSFAGPDTPNAQGRAFLLCTLAAWWEARS